MVFRQTYSRDTYPVCRFTQEPPNYNLACLRRLTLWPISMGTSHRSIVFDQTSVPQAESARRIHLANGPCAASKIKRALYTFSTLVQHMRVNHGRAHVGVAEKFLNGANVVAGFQQVCGERVSEAVTGRAFVDCRPSDGERDFAADGGLVSVMPALHPGSRIDRQR